MILGIKQSHINELETELLNTVRLTNRITHIHCNNNMITT